MSDEPAPTGARAARRAAASREGLWVTVASGSMVPTVGVGARVRVRSGVPLRWGHVVLLDAGAALTLHRVLATVPGTDLLVHGGDASGSGAQFARVATVVGVADLARRAPTGRQLREVVRLVADRALAFARRGR